MRQSRYLSRQFTIALLAAFVIVSSSAGCLVRRHPPDSRRIDTAKLIRTRQRVYERTKAEFDRAAFWKPWDSATAIAGLAPLIVQQVIECSNRDHTGARFGALVATASGSARVDTRRATVYFRKRAAKLGGVIRDQIEYVWFYASPAVPSGPDAIDFLVLRATLGEDGFPLVWEVDDSASRRDGDLQILFVADSLEALAMDAFGQPLPDRRYVIERNVADAPYTIVAKVLEDGPVPMGPYVYLSAEPPRVTTLLCRCSPSQVQAFTETGYYDLRPLNEIEDVLRRLPSRWALRLLSGDCDTKDNRSLDETLRWPRGRSGD